MMKITKFIFLFFAWTAFLGGMYLFKVPALYLDTVYDPAALHGECIVRIRWLDRISE